MTLKRFFVVLGVTALLGLLLTTPVAAAGHIPSLSLDPAAVPAEEGEVTVTVSGANWTELVPFFVTSCPGAGGDATLLTGAVAALSMCPTITSDIVPVDLADGTFSHEITVTITQADIDAGGLLILAGWLSAETSTNPEDGQASIALLAIGTTEDVDDGAVDDGEMDMGEETMDEGAEDTGAEDTGAEASGAEPMEEMPKTGHESSLPIVIGFGILIAGLLVVALARRLQVETLRTAEN